MLATIILLFSLVKSTIITPKAAHLLPLTETTGLAVDSDGRTIAVSSKTKVSILSYDNHEYTTIRTDGPFRTSSIGYTLFYSLQLNEFVLFGRERAVVGRFSSNLVGTLVDYEPSFQGMSTFFVATNDGGISLNPNNGIGAIKLFNVTHNPRLDGTFLSIDVFKKLYEGRKLNVDKIANYTKGMANSIPMIKDGNPNIILVILFDNIETHTTCLSLIRFHPSKLDFSIYEEDSWATKYPNYDPEYGYFDLGDLTSYPFVDAFYDAKRSLIMLMSHNSVIGSKNLADGPCAFGILLNVKRPGMIPGVGLFLGDFSLTLLTLTPPDYNYLNVVDYESFARNIDVYSKELDSNGNFELVLSVSAPKAKVQFGDEVYSCGIVLLYKYSTVTDTGYHFFANVVPPEIDNDIEFGIVAQFMEDTQSSKREVKLFIISSKDRYLYEITVPTCGDGIISTESGEECEGGDHCIMEMCVCEDGYVADGNGHCHIKCERNECDCDLSNSCTNCTIEHMDIETRCQECEYGYEFINYSCQEACGNGIRSISEECDGVEHCNDTCFCFNGYEPDGSENKCVLKHNGLLITWTVIIFIVGFALLLYIIITVVIKIIQKKANRIT